MSTGMPELGSKISLISKADIRYEGRLFTVDPQECTIALASVRSFGTEDRETQYPVAPQSQVYDYILFRGSDIKDIRVLNNVPSLPNDPAIMQMSVPPTLGSGSAPGQFSGQFAHPVVGQTPYQQYHPMGGFPGSVHTQLNKTSELSPQTSVDLAQPPPSAGPIGSGVHHSNQVKDQGSMLDLLGAASQQNQSRSTTPAVGAHRKSPTADQGTQVGTVPSGSGQQRDSRRGSGGGAAGKQPQRNRTNSRNRQRYPSGGAPSHHQPQQQNHHQQQNQSQPGAQQSHQGPHQSHQGPHQNHQGPHLNHQGPHQNHHGPHQNHQGPHQNHQGPHQNQQPGLMQPGGQNYHHNQHGQNYNRGGWRGRSRGRGRGFLPRNKNTLKFENDYDFEQANTEFEELRSQLAKTKITDEPIKPAEDAAVPATVGEVDKKDDSGNETGADVPEVDDDPYTGYDKTKSFFDNISCEAIERGEAPAAAAADDEAYTAYDKTKSFFDSISCVSTERSKGRSQRTDWRTERKLNSETFGVASARRGNWRGRGNWRHNPHHQPWRGNMRGSRGRPNMNMGPPQPRINQPRNPAPMPQPQPQAQAAK